MNNKEKSQELLQEAARRGLTPPGIKAYNISEEDARVWREVFGAAENTPVILADPEAGKLKINAETIRTICYHIIDIIDFYQLMERTPDCNTCGRVRECDIAPEPGQQVRYNCAYYEAEADRNDGERRETKCD